jgi:hypothetical protein
MIAPLYDASGKQLNFGYDGATIANRHNAFKPVSSPLISEDEVGAR